MAFGRRLTLLLSHGGGYDYSPIVPVFTIRCVNFISKIGHNSAVKLVSVIFDLMEAFFVY